MLRGELPKFEVSKHQQGLWGLRLRNVVKFWKTHSGIDHDISISTAKRHCKDPSYTEANSQGGPAIQTTVSLRGYVFASG